MPITARIGDRRTGFVGGRPRWEDVYNAYRVENINDSVFLQKYFHRHSYSQEFREHGIAGMRIEPSAARISIALIKSKMKDKFKNTKIRRNGREIEAGIEITKAPIGEEWIKGYRVISNVENLYAWLSQSEEDGGAGWGNEVNFTDEKWGNIATTHGREAINNRITAWADNRNKPLPCNGVLIIIAPQNSGRWVSNATLWIGIKRGVINGIVDVPNTNFRRNFKVYFWELRDGYPNKCGSNIHQFNRVICEVKCLSCPRTNIHEKLGCCHVMEIRRKINSAAHELHKIDRKYQKIGEMLKKMWDRYEDRLTIHSTNYIPETLSPYSKYGIKDEIYGIFININVGPHKLKGDYYGWKAYEMIIHEFFHNINHLIAKDFYCYANNINDIKDVDWDDILEQYRHQIITGANTEERIVGNAPAANYRRNVFDRDFTDDNVPHKNNFSYFYESLKEDFSRQICNEIKNIIPETVAKIYESSNGGLIDIFSGGHYITTEPKNSELLNTEYAAIYGHTQKYWDENPVFRLSEEALAVMSAAAIANLDTFAEFAKILPESCEYFIKILDKICKMLDKINQ
jgi:hypothetical protein